MRVGKLFNHSIFTILMLVSVCCMLVVIISLFKLPDIPAGETYESSNNVGIYSKDEKLGKFGELMIDMLPNDLAFTVFLPSEEAFEHDLRLRANLSFSQEEWDNAYATASLVLGFSAVPRKIYSGLISDGEVLSFDSISGFTLYISKDVDGVLVVNRIRAKEVDINKGEVVLHIMDGVIMDAEFEHSVLPVDAVEGDEMAN
ncbi:uncharacterized protein LOC130803021 [Amaranthus tricolor]|uniref:uncharacterized protein LOC130803021 n=1 Tax=Amaranthus tricolor TaxID=29722 RepID=UPI002585F9C1|nr:uncharacterized protein LOC130803021 [Amaranthus tricolor]